MIEVTRMYHLDKRGFQGYIIKSEDYRNIKMHYDIWTGAIIYPLKAERDGIFINADEYRAYINGFPRIIYNSSESPRLTTYQNLTFTKLKISLRILEEHIINLENTKLSGIKFGFSIPTNVLGAEIIKQNILMYNFNYYNHNKQKDTNQILKEFDFTDYKIGVYASRDNTYNEKVLKIVLHLKKSVAFKDLNIYNIHDLLQKKNLEGLFKKLLNRFDELIIVDNFDSSEDFEGKDYYQLKEFLDYRYWKNIANNKSRQTSYRKRKHFKKLIVKYGLDSIQLQLKKELKKAFRHFISN